MSYYPSQRKFHLYHPKTHQPYKLSRSKIDLFMDCRRCFYLDRRLGISRPPSFPFNLNSAVDLLLKKEFDFFRKEHKPHPLMRAQNIQAIPFECEELKTWRTNFQGIQFLHKKTQFIITGAIDDLWVNTDDELIVVDYKSTSKEGKVTLDAPWQITYKRQLEIYQWLLKKLGYLVCQTGYFVYCNGIRSKDMFHKRLDFTIDLLPYRGDDRWIEPTLLEIYDTLNQDLLPTSNKTCSFCVYRAKALQFEKPKDLPLFENHKGVPC